MIPLEHLVRRRRQLLERLERPALLFAGGSRPRNFPDNHWPDRLDSNFLFLFGPIEPDAAALFDPADGSVTLYLHARTLEAALWSGPVPSFEEMRERTGVDAVEPVGELEVRIGDRVRDRELLSLAVADTHTTKRARRITGLPLSFREADRIGPEPLVDALAALRMVKEPPEIDEIRAAVEVTAEAFAAVRKEIAPGVPEQRLAGLVACAYAGRGACPAFSTILSVRGEILHNHAHGNVLADGDLLLLDSGAEVASGWAADVTRTWPVSERWTDEQRAVYDVVLRANEAGIAASRPGARWRDVHFAAARVLAEGLVDLGLLRGQPDELVARGAHALFFPHGLGHFLGLDVHDLEAFGDRVLYEPDRPRSTQFGTASLRIDRDLAPGMVVTVEPGLYFVPGILRHPELGAQFADCLERERAEEFLAMNDGRGFGGIRIEDDVLVTEGDPEVLTAAIPKVAGA